MSDVAVARAVDELKRGRAVTVRDGEVRLAALAIELADDASLAAFDGGGRADLLVTRPRAAVLNLVNQLAAADAGAAVRIRRMPWMGFSDCLAAADPVRDLATPLKGPYETVALGAAERAGAAALPLAKLGGLLPALFVRDDGASADDRLVVEADAVLGFSATASLRIAARARLPIEATDDCQVIAFRSDAGGPEHLALVIGQPSLGGPVLTRLHSACLTGDLLGSLKCDCGPQLREALARLGVEGGMLLYLQQEGRGIGLINKLRAYALQDQGFDTVDANLRLGFEVDERDFALAAKMLDLLGVRAVRLLTNNPAKVAGLAAAGIEVTERVPHDPGAGAHNAAYLATKRDRTGHLL